MIDTSLITNGVLVAIGGVAVGHAFLSLSRGVASEEWPETAGEILESSVDAQSGRGGAVYVPSIRYRYAIGQSSYEGDRITFGGPVGTSWRRPAEEAVRRYAKGKRVVVRFHPADPAISVLEPGARWYTYAELLGGTVFAGLGIARIVNNLGWTLW